MTNHLAFSYTILVIVIILLRVPISHHIWRSSEIFAVGVCPRTTSETDGKINECCATIYFSIIASYYHAVKTEATAYSSIMYYDGNS